jgi:hypothetical protein
VTFGRRFGERFTLSLAAGAILDGELRGQGSVYDIGPGFLASLTAAYRLLGGPGKNPFLTLTLGYGMSFSETHEIGGAREDERLMAADTRLGALFGVTLFDFWSPYLAARIFGGPVNWQRRGEDRTGSDRHHYAIGLGSSFAVAPTLSIVLEAIPLGERTYGAGFSLSL